MTVTWKHGGEDDMEIFYRNQGETDNQLSARVAAALDYVLTTIGREPDYGTNIVIMWHSK